MATITSRTAESIDELMDENIVSGEVASNGHLILTSRGGSSVDAGLVPGLRSLAYVAGSIPVNGASAPVTSYNVLTDVDASLAISVTVPATGIVYIDLQGTPYNDYVGAFVHGVIWGLREGSGSVAGAVRPVLVSASTFEFTLPVLHRFRISGLLPGSIHTYKWGHGRWYDNYGSVTLLGQNGGPRGNGITPTMEAFG